MCCVDFGPLTVLQIAMPVFEGLFDPEDEVIIMNLLYLLATVHALAKLRIHTDATLLSLLLMISAFGIELRRFHSDVCSKYETMELRHESQQRTRREAAESLASSSASAEPASSSTSAQPSGKLKLPRGVVKKKFSLLRPKLHFLGDYVRIILQFGTTDSYTTAIVSDHLPSRNS